MSQHKIAQEMAICDWMAVILFTALLTNILMWLDGFAIDNSGLFYVYYRTHQDFSHISRLLLQLPINLLLIRVCSSAWKSSIRRFVIMEKAPSRAFSWLKAATTAFTFKTLLRHYAKRALTPQSLNVKLGPQHNYHKGRAAIRHYANQTARLLLPLRRGPNFKLRDRGVNAHLV